MTSAKRTFFSHQIMSTCHRHVTAIYKNPAGVYQETPAYASQACDYCCRFFMHLLLLFLIHQFGVSLYRAVATAARNIVVANAAGMMFLLCVFLMDGFVIQRRYLHPWVIW